MTTLKNVINDYLGEYDFSEKHVLEFGPCIKEGRLALCDAVTAAGGKYYALDHCSAHDQSPEEGRAIAAKYGFELDVIDYNDTIDYRADGVTTAKSAFFRANYYDVIFARCSWHTKYSATTLNLMKLCNMIGKQDCKVILIPWFNDANLSEQHYVDTFKEISYAEHGFRCEQVDDGIYNYAMRAPTLVISKNINL